MPSKEMIVAVVVAVLVIYYIYIKFYSKSENFDVNWESGWDDVTRGSYDDVYDKYGKAGNQPPKGPGVVVSTPASVLDPKKTAGAEQLNAQKLHDAELQVLAKKRAQQSQQTPLLPKVLDPSVAGLATSLKDKNWLTSGLTIFPSDSRGGRRIPLLDLRSAPQIKIDPTVSAWGVSTTEADYTRKKLE